MNNLGHVVGDFADCEVSGVRHGFLWTPEDDLTVFEHPPGVAEAHHFDISDNGMIVGIHRFPGQGFRGFAYDPATESYQYLAPLHEDAVAHTVSSANAINNAGIVAGSRIIGKPGQSPMPYNAVIWNTNTGEVIDLGVMEGPNSVARDIDEETNEIVGWTGQSISSSSNAVIQLDEKFLLLEAVPGTHTSHASYRNRSLVVTGSGANTQEFFWRGYIWNKSFDVVEPPRQFNSSSAGAINDAGQVIFLMATGSSLNRPYLWQHGVAIDLNELKTSGPLLTRPSDINNKGQILVRAATTAVLLTPVDVPLADLNYDCNVDVYDLLILLEQWSSVSKGTVAGEGTGVPSADLNGDGVVNVLDLLILLENWSR